jgi:hypothetical protein
MRIRSRHRSGWGRFEPRRLLRRLRDVAEAVWEWIVTTVLRLTGELRRRALLANMVEADIILASPRTLRLSPIALVYRMLLRATYVHSMLYLGKGRMLHTTSRHGVVVSPVPRTIYRRNRYAVYRVPYLRARQRRRVVEQALKFRAMKLDKPALVTNIPSRLLALRRPLLRLEKNRLWCSKLIERAYAAAGIELVAPDRKDTVTSEDLACSPALVRL